jgi:hypothetical protein
MEYPSILIPGACNLNCLFCLPPGKLPPVVDTSLESILLRAREIRAAGHTRIMLGVGGFEPTTYPHIIEVIQHCREQGFERIQLNTGAYHTSDRALVANLASAGLTDVAITLFSEAPATTDAISGGKNVLDRKTQSIRNAIEFGLCVTPIVLLLAQTAAEAAEIVSLFLSLLLPSRKRNSEGLYPIALSFPSFTGDISGYRVIAPTYAAFAENVLLSALQFPEEHFSIINVPRCAFPKTMGQNIKVHFHAEHPQSADTLSEDIKTLFHHRRFPECRQCPEQNSCEGVPESYLKVHRRFQPWAEESHGAQPDSQTDGQCLASLLTTRLRSLTGLGWAFSYVVPIDDSRVEAHFNRGADIVVLMIGPRSKEMPGFCSTKRHSIFYNGAPGSHIPPEAEMLARKVQKTIRDMEAGDK